MQADTFIDYVIDVTGLQGRTRVVRFRNENMDIDKVNLGNRVCVPHTEATDPAIRRKVNHSKITLSPKTIMIPWEISDVYLEHNIEGDQIESHIMKMFATAAGNDLEDLYVNGDKLGQLSYEGDILEGGSTTEVVVDTYLKLCDGWLKRAGETHIVDHDGVNIKNQVFSDMIIQMPSKFKKNKRNLKFFINDNTEQLYRNNLSSRATALGDTATMSENNMTPFGIELVPLALLPQTPAATEHVTLSGTTTVNLLYKNIVAGTELVVASDIDNAPKVPRVPYVEGTDYTMDYANGTIVRIGGGSIGDGEEVKVTYQTNSRIFLTEYRNLILAIGREMTMESDRNIYSQVNEFAMSIKVDVNIENTDAVVLGINIGLE
jgi:hypothetical protein